MKVFKFLLLAVAVIAAICIINVSLYCISIASTLANMFGALLIALLISGIYLFINKYFKPFK